MRDNHPSSTRVADFSIVIVLGIVEGVVAENVSFQVMYSHMALVVPVVPVIVIVPCRHGGILILNKGVSM